MDVAQNVIERIPSDTGQTITKSENRSRRSYSSRHRPIAVERYRRLEKFDDSRCTQCASEIETPIFKRGAPRIIRQSNCQPLRPCGECSLRVAMSSLPPLFALIPLKNERRRVPFCFRSYRMTFRSPGIEVPKASTTVDHGGSPSLSLYDGGILARKLGPCCSYPRKNKRWKSCIVDRLGMQNNESMILVARRCSSE